MSVVMKKHLTKLGYKQFIICFVYEGHTYHIPQDVAEQFKYKPKQAEKISSEIVFRSLENEYTKVGALLLGVRHREGLTQKEMAQKIGITQSDLSKMEHGKRAIGKNIARRIEKIFGVHYRYFL